MAPSCLSVHRQRQTVRLFRLALSCDNAKPIPRPHTPKGTRLRPPAPTTNGADATLIERTISHVLGDTQRMMERLLEGTRQSLQKLEDQSRTPGERHALIESRQQLTRLCFVMAERYPDALRQAIAQDANDQHRNTRSLFTVHFDDLELMDEHQISVSVERARAREVLADTVDAALAELNGLISAAMGQASVNPESNPLRPEMFLQALQTVVGQMQVTDSVRRDWMGPMSQALGGELRGLYGDLATRLQQAGIKPIGFAMRQADGRHAYLPLVDPQGLTPGFAAEPLHANTVATASSTHHPDRLAPQATAQNDTLLTLDRLRRLLLGEFCPPPDTSRLERFSEQFSREFDQPDLQTDASHAPDFEITVPAAFEALQEMNQVDRLMERLGSPRAPGQTLDTPPAGLGQALSQEVVALMVDNLAQDPRLLPPVQKVVRDLEPALMQLAVGDPRFFSDREHPARCLLQEITDRSLAFENVAAPGFESFLVALNESTLPLVQGAIRDKEDFEPVLEHLRQLWTESEQQHERERLRAIESLWRAEQRHLLASRIARQIRHLPEFCMVPADIGNFLQGPWAQVLAQVRLNNDSGHPDPGRYRELVDALLWSAQPDETRKNPARLARLVPKLLARLQDGLATIGYPQADLTTFMETLMRLHQMAFQGPASPPAKASLDAPADADPQPSAITQRGPDLPESTEPWLAPAEARESGFMEAGVLDSVVSGNAVLSGDEAPESEEVWSDAPDMPMGTWVDLQVAGKWERTQLTWMGPHGTLFLFTSASGRSQSMTKRLRDRLLAKGTLRVVAQQTVVGEALDAVARTAMRNSVDTRY